MLVVIEGPDGSGKSTLVELIRQRLGIYHISLRFGGNPAKEVDDLVRISRYLLHAAPDPLVVCDRFPLISEMIYGPIIRQENRLRLTVPDLARRLFPESAEFRARVVVVFCEPPFEDLSLTARKAEQMSGVHLNLGRLARAYHELATDLSSYSGDVFFHDFSADPTGERILTVIRSIHSERNDHV